MVVLKEILEEKKKDHYSEGIRIDKKIQKKTEIQNK